MPKLTLTDRQKLVFDFIVSFIADHGYPPTIREIGRAIEVTNPQGVQRHIEALTRKGYVERQGRAHRSLTIVVRDNA